MKNKNYLLVIFFSLLFIISSCTDIEKGPYSKGTADVVLKDQSNFISLFAKVYGGYVLTGQIGPHGDADIQGADEGATAYLRSLWYLQELCSDEAIMRWSDAGVRDFNKQGWQTDNSYINLTYWRMNYQAALCNSFIELSEYSTSSQTALYVNEVRVLRALTYFHLMDLFGNVPIVTKSLTAKEYPAQNTRAQIFNFIESELKVVENNLKDPKTNEYARVDKAVAWMILAKLYLNAEVFIGQSKYNEAITYLNKIISSNAYSLDPNYRDVFAADNHTSSEIIFPLPSDATKSQSWGGATFFARGLLAGVANTITGLGLGANGGWGGPVALPDLPNLFNTSQSANYVGQKDVSVTDKRFFFFDEGTLYSGGTFQKRIITTDPFTTNAELEGYRVKKFINVKKDGTNGTTTSDHADNDFPLFRLADVYLMYAEATVRGGNGDMNKAVEYVNLVRTRASATNITASDLTLDFLLDERGRELYFECHRRTDLIRFGKFTTKKWAWKGGVLEGVETIKDHLKIYPIPNSQLIANPSLKQNPGY